MIIVLNKSQYLTKLLYDSKLKDTLVSAQIKPKTSYKLSKLPKHITFFSNNCKFIEQQQYQNMDEIQSKISSCIIR